MDWVSQGKSNDEIAVLQGIGSETPVGHSIGEILTFER